MVYHPEKYELNFTRGSKVSFWMPPISHLFLNKYELDQKNQRSFIFIVPKFSDNADSMF